MNCKTDLPLDCANFTGQTTAQFDGMLTMAFQPIFDAATGEVFAHEALVRKPDGANASEVLASVNPNNRYSFDRKCRDKAIEMASALNIKTRLSINCMPNAVLDPMTCLRSTIATARRHDFPIENIIFEFTETEYIDDIDQFRAELDAFRHLGFKTAFDDFGAGYAGLVLLTELQPDFVKLDMRLVCGIDRDNVRTAIVDACLRMCADMSIKVIVEGVETRAEFDHLYHAGARLFQGFLLGKPKLEGLIEKPAIRLPIAA